MKPAFYKRCQLLLIAALAVCLFAFQQGKEVFDLTGDIKDADNVQISLVWDLYGEAKTLAKDTIRHGYFHLQCPVNEVMNVSLTYHKGRDMYSYPVIIEKGKVKFQLMPTGLSQVTGGKYNTWVLGYQHDTAYVRTDKLIWQSRQPGAVKGGDAEWESIQNFMHHFDVRSQYLQKILNNGKDPVAAAIAAVLLELEPDRAKTMVIVNAAAQRIGDSSYVIRQARKMDKAQRELIARRQGAMVGEAYVDFTLPAINGTPVRLGSLVSANKYTLLQFWASWCVPCRAEIPVLKQLYSTYHPKGLEIVSFSMDNSHTNWMKASEKEGMSWPNVSDLLADKSPVIKSYPVNGIPANVIIDQQGKIVASNLLGEELEEK